MATNEYLETEVMTASPHRLHLMVVDGAIRHAGRAREALLHNDLETAHVALNKSRESVAELIGGLDPQQSPDLVARMKQLFAFVYQNLATADLERNVERVDAALRILRMHRETWLALAEKLSETSSSDTWQSRSDTWQSRSDTGQSSSDTGQWA